MSKKQEFIKFVKDVMDTAGVNEIPNEEARLYWEAFLTETKNEKPTLTDNGKMVLKFMRENNDTELWKARDIAEAILISSRGVSGAMRKLVTDGFVEKRGQDPTIYTLTEKGKNIEIN